MNETNNSLMSYVLKENFKEDIIKVQRPLILDTILLCLRELYESNQGK